MQCAALIAAKTEIRVTDVPVMRRIKTVFYLPPRPNVEETEHDSHSKQQIRIIASEIAPCVPMKTT